MNEAVKIQSPHDPALDQLCRQLAELSGALQQPDAWPGPQLQLCGRCGVFEWFVPRQWGGQEWNEADLMAGYVRLAAACLTTTFVITQRSGACRRIAASDNEWVKERYLPGLTSGELFATVGISHLTTSRRHLARPVLRAQQTSDGFVLEGFSPWVTGARHADVVVIGATLEDGRQVLLAVPMDLPGITVPPPARLVALNASQTGEVHFDRVRVEGKYLLAGPVQQVMKGGSGAGTGGLQTSALALGLSAAVLEYLEREAAERPDLQRAAVAFRAEWDQLRTQLLQLAAGQSAGTAEQLRTRANSLVLRCSQSALAAAKGTGYLADHPVGRWCCEALFFLVWSCPHPVMAANLCELAGIAD